MQAIIHPYESKLANYMESVLFMWLVGLLGLGNTTALQAQLQDNVEADHNPKWPNALLYIPVVCGGVVLIVHLLFLIWYNYYDVINGSIKWVQSIIHKSNSVHFYRENDHSYPIHRNLPYKQKLKKHLMTKSSQSVHKIRYGLSISYSTRKQKLLRNPNVTESVVGFDDGEEQDNPEQMDGLRTQIQ